MPKAAHVLAMLAGLAPAAVSQQAPPPIVTDRPDQTESAAVVARGFLQLEVGGSHAASDARTTNLGAALARIGVFPGVELRLGFGGWHRRTQDPAASVHGVGDFDVGAKVALTRGRGGVPAIALLGHVTLPTGHEAFGAAGNDPQVRAALSHELPGGIGLGYNLGVQWTAETVPGGDESLRADALYTLTLARSLSDLIGAFLEGFGVLGVSEGRPSWHALDGGLTFGVRPNLQLDLSAGVGLTAAAEDWFVGAGVAVRVPR